MESTTLKLITTANAAELLAVSETVAKKVLLRYGLHPVDYGPGRGRGLRWPYLGVLRVIEQMQTEATVKTVKATNKKKNPQFKLAVKSADEVMAMLTKGKRRA